VLIAGTGVVADHASAGLSAAGITPVWSETFSQDGEEQARSIRCALVCLDTPNPELIGAVNQTSLSNGWNFVPGQIESGVGLIGPTVVPHQSACYRCFALRREADLPVPRAIESSIAAAPAPLFACVGGLMALEAMRIISGLALPQTMGRVLKVDFFAPEMTWLRVLRLPNCPDCGYDKYRLPSVPKAGM